MGVRSAFSAVTSISLTGREEGVGAIPGKPLVSIDQVLIDKPTDMMLRYFQALAEQMPPDLPEPRTREAWEQRRTELRRQLWQSMGDFPLEERSPLSPRITGRLDRGDHVIEKVVYESMPGLFVTALVYLPKKLEGKAPAVLCVNGHWPLSKATPLIQQRCVGLTRMGVIAFCQDVIGTGERAGTSGRAPLWYHGMYRGAAPRIVGRSLLGYIMYECLRALDYVLSRPEVDPSRIMCTGASGGGKQSMFFAALDDRLAGAVPVCYLSSYQAHMGATACVGEVPVGVLRYTNQWEILGMHAPRPLLGIAATRDVPWFQPKLMFDTLQKTRERIYSLYGAEDLVHGAEVDSGHDYNQPMRELLYNHVATHLQRIEDPHIVEPPDLPVESEETLRCGLPSESETVQSLTFKEAQKMVAAIQTPCDLTQWRKRKEDMLTRLREVILGGFPKADQVSQSHIRNIEWEGHRIEHWTLETEPGVVVPAVLCKPGDAAKDGRRPAVLVVEEEGKKAAFSRGFPQQLAEAGFVSLALDYRGTGETTDSIATYADVADYNLSNYSLFVGRPLAGMRVFDLRCALDLLENHPEVDRSRIAIVGRGMGAFTGLLTGAFDERIVAVAAEEMLATWVFPEEFDNIGISYLIPGILTVGDISHLAACVSPRPLLLLNAVDGQRRPIEEQAWEDTIRFTRSVYDLSDASNELRRERVASGKVPGLLIEWLKQHLSA